MGKTTLVNSIVGVTRYFGGTIRLNGRDITGLRADQRAQRASAGCRRSATSSSRSPSRRTSPRWRSRALDHNKVYAHVSAAGGAQA